MATNKNASYKTYNGTDWDTINFTTTASNVSIADAGGIITATNVEGALQEIQGNVNTHKNDTTKHIPTGGTTGQLLSKASSGFEWVEPPSPSDVDKGRYRAEFGFDGGEIYNGTVINNNIVSLTNTYGTTAGTIDSADNNFSVTAKNGIKIYVNSTTLFGLKFSLNSGVANASKVYVLDASKNVLYLASFSGFNGQIDYTFNANTYYYIVLDNNGSTWLRSNKNTSLAFPYTSTDVNIVGSLLDNTTDSTTTLMCFYSITAIKGLTTGTVTKTYSPSDIKKWGNMKWTQTTPTNTSVVCDVLSNTNIIPTMTSNTLPSGVASASTFLGTGWEAYKAFDNSDTTGWLSNATSTGWLQYQFTSSKNIGKYSLFCPNTFSTSMPKNWTFEGSNNGTNWTILDTVINQTGWVDSETRYYNVQSIASYTYYRLNISANNGNSYVAVGGFNMYCAIKSNVTSITDLSDIDITQYPTLNVRYTLTRTSSTDTSPTVSNPSITWEGELIITKIAHGTFTDTTTSIEAYKAYTLTIPLGFSAQRGRLFARRGDGNGNAGAIITFNTTQGNSIGFSFSVSNYPNGYTHSVASQLSDNFYDNGNNAIRINSCYISEKNLVIEFKNTGGYNYALSVFGKWEVEG